MQINKSKKEEIDNSNRKFEGIEFEGVMCSALAGDQFGLDSPSMAELISQGVTINYEFMNGSVLPLHSGNFEDFKKVWRPFRLSFFK